MVNLLGVDPGLANCGWARVGVNGTVQIFAVGVIETEPAKKKAKLHHSHDTIRRIDYLYRQLHKLSLGCDAICMEGISIPRNSSATLKLGAAFGVITALAAALDVPLLQASTAEVRDALGGAPKGGKDPRIETIERIYPGLLDTLNQGAKEHAVDAVGVALALQHDPVILGMRRVREHG